MVAALLASGKFTVRVVSRDPVGAAAKALSKRGVEVIKGDLLDAPSLRFPFEGAFGAFVVTNFWDPAQMHHETEIGAAAVRAAHSAGVKHLVWSTLPDCERLSGGRFKVAHYTDKAHVDAVVEARTARDVSVLRAIYLLRSRAREAHRRGQCLGPGRVHGFCRLGEGPHEADLIFCSLVKATREPPSEETSRSVQNQVGQGR